MIFSQTTLKNGLRIVTAPMPSMESATVQILIGSGTREETKRTNGIAHFLEHMVFKGTKAYPTAQDISVAVDKIGAEINANTSKERTAYYIKAWERYLSLAFDILSGFIHNPILNPEEIEREKGVIIEEIAMYEDLPMQKAPEIFEELLYGDTSLGWDTLGTRETVTGIKKEDFLEYRQDFYTPENMVLSVAGKFDQKEVLRLAEEYFGVGGSMKHGVRRMKYGTERNSKKQPINPSKKPEIKLLERKTEQAHLVLGFRGNPLGSPDRYIEAVLASILGGGMSSRLFTEIRERRGLAYYVRTSVDHYRDTGYMSTRAGVRTANIEEAIKVTLGEYAQLRDEGVKDDEINKAKEYLKGKLALGLEDTHSVSEFFGDQELFEDKVRTVDEVMEGVDKVDKESVQKLSKKFFQNARLNLAVVGPYNDSNKFQQLLKLG